MTLDIRFKNKPPVQYQKVMVYTLYTLTITDSLPEVIIHFQDYLTPTITIPTDDILSICATNE